MNGLRMSTMLDQTDVTLDDIAVVRFLICCEDEGAERVQCPLYVREWMTGERIQESGPNFPSVTWKPACLRVHKRS